MFPEKRAHADEAGRERLSGAAGLPEGYGSFGRAMARAGAAPLREGNRLTLLRDAPETYEEWLWAISRAERRVHLENYIFRADRVGYRFAEVLEERAAAGVSVRVLVDWFGCANVPRAFWERLRRAGVEVRLVNPPDLAAPLEGFRRDHRKLLAVDGTYGSTGGVCIAEDWLKSSPQSGLTYRDTAVGVRGPAVADLERAFATAWEAAGGPLPLAERPGDRETAPAGGEAARVVAQEPGRTRMLRVLELLCASVERRLWITDAYFLSLPILTEALKAAARDGVDVRLLLPATNDLPLIGAVSRTGYRDLLESGVGIWEYGGPMIHAKTAVADGWWSRVGSTNLNVSSLLANWELDLVVEDRAFAARMEEMFERDLANAREVRLGGPRQRPSPERSISRSERRRRGPESGARAAATVRRVGGTALRESTDPLRSHERVVAAAFGGGLIGASLLGARFPRALAWPLAAAGGLLGTSFLLSAAKPPEPPARRPSPGE